MGPGDVIGERFEIERPAGTGGMGVVYRALDRWTGAPVAVKVLHAYAGDTERFLREAELLAGIEHPGIVRYVAHGTAAEGLPYLAMEWLEGESLADRLAREPLTLGESVAVIARVAEALAGPHEQGVVHRDLKPGNVYLVDRRLDRVKLLDFGIARVTGAPSGMTRTGTVLGTPGYMAPEQARGERDVDPRADVFALGCMLFKCVTGAPAFGADDAIAVLLRVVLDEPPRLADLRPDVPPALGELVARMLDKTRGGRPSDARAVAIQLAALGPLAESLPVRRAEDAPALTATERRVLCLVLMRPEPPPGAAAERSARDKALAAIAEKAGSRLDRLADGSALVTFASSAAATDQATRAARCALALRAAAPAGPMVLATGRAVVAGPLPVGEVIERATRMLRAELARARRVSAGAIAIDDVSAGLLDPRFEVSGSAEGLELRGERTAAWTVRTLLGKPTTCVGRDRELAMLDGWLDECGAESVARAVLITGAPGIGKSRLRYEFLRRVHERSEIAFDDAPTGFAPTPVEVWIARGDPVSAGSPLGLIAQIVRLAAGLRDGEPLEARRLKLAGRVARHVPRAEQARVAEFLGEIVAAPFPDDGSVQLRAARQDRMLMGEQMQRAWVDLVDAECAAGPLVIVLEDLHWGDLPTVRLVDAALRTSQERPFMVLALARPEVSKLFPRLWVDRAVLEIRLGELSRRAAERLAREALGPEADPATVARVVERAAGHPFCLEELIRGVAERREQGPSETVLAIAQARLEALDPEARRHLRAASVFGQSFWREGVLALLGGAPTASPVPSGLAALVEREVIEPRASARFAGQEEYAFRHPLVREAAYAMLTERDRALGHRLAAAWLESAGETDAGVLADHFDKGEQAHRAAGCYRRAAEDALAGNDLAAVLARAERGIACALRIGPDAATRGPATPLDREARDVVGALRRLQAEAHKWRGELAEAERTGLAALDLVPPGSALFCDAAREVAVASSRLEHHDVLERVVRALCVTEPEPSAVAGQAIALASAFSLLVLAGQYAAADLLVQPIEAAVRRLPRPNPLVAGRVLQARAIRAMHAGDLGGSLALLRTAVERFEEAGSLRSACTARSNLGFACIEVGAYPEAERTLREALAEGTRLGLTVVATIARSNLGYVLGRLGAFDEAVRVEREALAAFHAQGDLRQVGACRTYLASILAAAGELPAAESEAREAVSILLSSPHLRLHALALLGQTLLGQGQAAEALVATGEGFAILERVRNVESGEALLRLVDAEARWEAGDPAGARAAITEAADRLRARSALIGDAELRGCFLGKVPENARTLGLQTAWGLSRGGPG